MENEINQLQNFAELSNFFIEYVQQLIPPKNSEIDLNIVLRQCLLNLHQIQQKYNLINEQQNQNQDDNQNQEQDQEQPENVQNNEEEKSNQDQSSNTQQNSSQASDSNEQDQADQPGNNQLQDVQNNNQQNQNVEQNQDEEEGQQQEEQQGIDQLQINQQDQNQEEEEEEQQQQLQQLNDQQQQQQQNDQEQEQQQQQQNNQQQEQQQQQQNDQQQVQQQQLQQQQNDQQQVQQQLFSYEILNNLTFQDIRPNLNQIVQQNLNPNININQGYWIGIFFKNQNGRDQYRILFSGDRQFTLQLNQTRRDRFIRIHFYHVNNNFQIKNQIQEFFNNLEVNVLPINLNINIQQNNVDIVELKQEIIQASGQNTNQQGQQNFVALYKHNRRENDYRLVVSQNIYFESTIERLGLIDYSMEGFMLNVNNGFDVRQNFKINGRYTVWYSTIYRR